MSRAIVSTGRGIGKKPRRPRQRHYAAGLCACGCGRSLVARSEGTLYFNAACRQRAYRQRVQVEMTRVGLPAPSLKAARVMSPTTPRNGDAQTAGNDGLTRGRKPSGLQVSFWKAQAALELFLEANGAEAPRNLSLSILAGALSDRQREQLHERKRAKRAPGLTVAEQRATLERDQECAV